MSLDTDLSDYDIAPSMERTSRSQPWLLCVCQFFREFFSRPDYLPARFIVRAIRPMVVLYLSGISINIYHQNWLIAICLALMTTGVLFALLNARYRSLHWLFPVSTGVLPGLLTIYLLYVPSPTPAYIIIYPIVSVVFMYASIQYIRAALVSIFLLIALAPGIYQYLGPIITVRMTMVLLLVIWVLYLFTRTLAKQHTATMKLSATDDLTELPNRRALNESLIHWQQFKQRYPDTKVTMALIDLDHFKRINDQLGHLSGDAVLQEFASYMNQRIRATDLLARYGGEEFALILPNTSAEQANHIIDDLRERVAETPFLGDTSVTFSSGIAEINPNESLDSWISRSDKALYAAKDLGRNCNELG